MPSSLATLSSSRQSKAKLVVMSPWSCCISAVIRVVQQLPNWNYQAVKIIKWYCDCMVLKKSSQDLLGQGGHNPQTRGLSWSTCPFFTGVLLWNLCLLLQSLLPGEVPKGSSSPSLAHVLLMLFYLPEVLVKTAVSLCWVSEMFLVQVSCRWDWEDCEELGLNM